MEQWRREKEEENNGIKNSKKENKKQNAHKKTADKIINILRITYTEFIYSLIL